MIREIRKRLQILEQAKQKVEVPDLVIIFWDETKNQWIAQEQYVKKNPRGKVIPESGTVKLIPLDRPEDYKPPEGFRGTVINEGILE